MNSRNELIKKFHQAVNIMLCDIKTSRCYGTEHSLTFSDISFLKCVERNEKAKAGEISRYLGITNGAVVQLARKLERKDYLEAYRMEGNKKEVYYRLTESGRTACGGYDEYNEDTDALIETTLKGLDEKTIRAVIAMFDAIINGIKLKKGCYIKITAEKTEQESKPEGRCEKCKRTY